MMHILMFSYDRTLVEGEQVGDTLLRHKGYAEYLDKLDIVVPAPSKTRRDEIKASEKLSIFPSYGPRMLSWLRAYLKAGRICRQNKVDVIATQDALLGFLGMIVFYVAIFGLLFLGLAVWAAYIGYGLYGAVANLRGKDFRYAILGSRLERYLEQT